MSTQTQSTPLEMAQDEERAERQLDAWVSAYKEFPTPNNFAGAVARLRDYQTAWMNGRKRNP